MPQKRRVYLVRYTHDPIEQDVFSNMSKISKTLDLDISYNALIARLHRAKKRTGRRLIRLRDKQGQPITLEVRDMI